ncbi:MAG: YihY family inner membrane protein [Pseudomonadota bacterium]
MKSLLAKAKQYFYITKSFITLAVDLYIKKNCQQSAASLTYMTLFAIVPMMTVTYSMFSIIPAFQALGDQFQAMIFANILPSNEDIVVQYLQDFSQQARQLTVFGVLFLMASAYFMLKNIEEHFNAIWTVPQGRHGVSNFLLYWAILSLGPLLLGLALVMNTYLLSLHIFVGNYDSYDIVAQLFKWLPWLFTSAAFTLLFLAVPNCKVYVGHAVLGGVLTMLAFQLCKLSFSWIVSHSSLKFIYGAFAVVPLFLLWINLSWMIVLGGAVFVRTISLYQIGLKNRGYPDFFGCLLVLWQFHQASYKGDHVSNKQLLHLGLSSEQWQRLREILLNHHVISISQRNELVLSRDLAHLTLWDIKQFLGAPRRLPDDLSYLRNLPWLPYAQNYLGRLDTIENESLSMTVEAFFTTTQSDIESDKNISAE